MHRSVQILAGIVVGALTLMAVLAISGILKARNQARVVMTTVELHEYASASTNFFALSGVWPQTPAELISNSMSVKFVAEPLPWTDGWGHLIVYTPYSQSNRYGSVLSFGRDGRPGGSGPDADIEVRFP